MVVKSEKQDFGVKTSFRKFIDKEIRNRPVWSEMAVGTSETQGGLPTTQGLANVVMMCGESSVDRARVMKWLLNKGLFLAVRFRNQLTDWALDKAEEVPIQKKPQQTNWDALADKYTKKTGTYGMRHFMAKESYRTTGVPNRPTLYKYSKSMFGPTDLFNARRRADIPALNKLKDAIDQRWENEFYNNFKVPIVKGGEVIGWFLLRKLNHILEKQGYEGFYYGGEKGYLNYVEKGDYKPEWERAHYQSDPAQRHGVDLSDVSVDDNDPTGTFYKFSNIGSPRSVDGIADTVRDMEMDFITLAGDVETGKAILDKMHRKIADKIRDDFYKREMNPQADSYAREKYGIHSKKGLSHFRSETIEELLELAEHGLKFEFNITNASKIPNEYKSKLFSKIEGDTVVLKPETQLAVLKKMFRAVDFNNLESQHTWPISTNGNWHVIFKQITGAMADVFMAAGVDKGNRYTLATIISNATKNGAKMSKILKYELNREVFGDMSAAAREVTKEARPLTEKGLQKLVDLGFTLRNKKRLPDDIEEVKMMVDAVRGQKITVMNPEEMVDIVKRGEEYFLVFNAVGDKSFNPEVGGIGMAGGTMMPADQEPRSNAYPMPSEEEQEKLERDLLYGFYGGEDHFEDAYKKDEKGNYTMSSKDIKNILKDTQLIQSVVDSALAIWNQGNISVGNIDKKNQVITAKSAKGDFERGDVESIAIEALRALGGHWAMKYGFITDAHYRHFTKFDPNKEMANPDGGRTLAAGIRHLLSSDLGKGIDLEGQSKEDFARAITDRFWTIVKDGYEPDETDFGEKIWGIILAAMYGGISPKDRQRGRGTAFYGRMVMLRKQVIAEMTKIKKANVNAGGGTINIATDDEKGGGGGGKSNSNPLEVGGADKDLARGHEQFKYLNQDRFEMLKGNVPGNMMYGNPAKIYGKYELPETLEELEKMIDEQKSIMVSSSIKVPLEIAKANWEMNNKGGGDFPVEDFPVDGDGKTTIRVKYYLYTFNERDYEAEKEQNTNQPIYRRIYVISHKSPEMGKGIEDSPEEGEEKPERAVSMTGFLNPDDFGDRVKNYKHKRTQTPVDRPAGSVPSGTPAQQAVQKQAQPEPDRFGLLNPTKREETPAPTPEPDRFGLLNPTKREAKMQESQFMPQRPTCFRSYKNWKETYAVFDPKMKKPKKGSGFNWWGTPGNAHGTEIGGEVETANSDPDGTKGAKHGKRKKRAS